MLLKAGTLIHERLLACCTGVNGNVFSVGDLAGLLEKDQVTPALQVMLHSYVPSEDVGGDAIWREVWIVVVVVKNVSRRNRELAMLQDAEKLIADVLVALSGWTFPQGSGVTGSLELTPPPKPMFTDSHAYIPLAFTARPKTRGCEEVY